MRQLFTLAIKDLRIMSRARAALFFAIGWPILMAILFGLMFGGGAGEPRKLRIAAVDEDRGVESEAFLTQLTARGGLDVQRTDRATATDLVRRGTRVAAVIVPSGFGAARARGIGERPPSMELLTDPSRKAEAAMIEGVLYGIGLEAAAARASSAGAGAWKPIDMVRHSVTADRTGPRSGFDISFVQGLVWGLIGCAMTFAISLVTERTHGTLVRLRMAPLSAAQVLGGKALACFLALMVMQSTLIGIGVLVFRIRVAAPLPLFVSMLAAAAAFVGLMMFIASIGRNEQATSGAGWAMLMPMSLFGGGMVPLFVMPAWMAPFSNVSLIAWAVRGFEGAIWRGFALGDFLLPWAILFLAGAAGFALGTRNLRRAEL